VVDLDSNSVLVFTLKGGEYACKSYEITDKTLKAKVLPGCEIDLEALFAAGE
jgi:hypothetical protein